MGKPFLVLRISLRRSRQRSRRATNSGPVKSTAGRAIARRTRSGIFVGPGCMKNCQPRAMVMVSPGVYNDDTGPLRWTSFHPPSTTSHALPPEVHPARPVLCLRVCGCPARPLWFFASNVQYDGELDPGGPIFAGKLYRSNGTPILSPQHQFFVPVEVGRISMWQFGDTLTINASFAPTCPTCEPRVVGRYYVRLM